MSYEQKSPHYISRVNFSSPEDILQDTLGRRFGDRYHEYRQAYYASLSARDHGQHPDTPHTLTIEFVNRCNLTCDMCYVANHTFPKSTLKLDEIRKLIDEAASFGGTGLILGVGSEGFLYKELDQVVEYARSAGIMDIIMMTNGTLLSDKMAEFLVRQQVSRVCISIDAATRETYKIVRGKDELERVENNVRSLVAAKKRLGSTLPVVRLSFCVTPENQHEQFAFRDKWEGVVDYIDYQKLTDFSYVGREDEADLPDEDPEPLFCTKPFGYLNVWSNGDISPCCTFYGKDLTFGNIRSHSLKEVYDGEAMQDLRRQFLTGKNINKACRVCLSKRENLIDDGLVR